MDGVGVLECADAKGSKQGHMTGPALALGNGVSRLHIAVLVAIATAAAGPRIGAAEGLEGSTRNFILPTGELTKPGDVRWSQQQLFVAHTVGIGITDDLELDLIVPGVPIGGQAQLRVALLPRTSNTRLVAGGGVVLFPGIGAITTASGTAAYRTENVDVHASIMAYNGQSFDGRMGILSAGVTYRFADNVALMVDATRFSVPDTRCSTSSVGSHCDTVLDTATVYTIGFKIIGKKLSGDVGIMLIEELDLTPLPVITIHH